MICFHFSIFESLETTRETTEILGNLLWFAFILVSLNHWKQPKYLHNIYYFVVICFHFSIFESLETTKSNESRLCNWLWFAFILVSLNHWKQPTCPDNNTRIVVICFHFSIFESLETTAEAASTNAFALWFAFILVSLNHWKQHPKCVDTLFAGCDLLSF